MADRIKVNLPGSKVYLFGSYAWGRPKPSSDLDLAVISHQDLDPQQLRDFKVRALKALQAGAIPVDLLVYRQKRLDELGPGSLAFKIRSEGVLL